MWVMRRALVSVRNPGIELGAVVVDGSRVVLEGGAEAVLAAMVRDVGERPAAELVMAEGWANAAGLYFAEATR